MPMSSNATVEVFPCLSHQDLNSRQFRNRRIFVQTDDGSVVGVNVHRSDNPSTVKKAVQSALYVPTEQSDLVFGGCILKDFSKICNDVPIRLQKISRRGSSPCLSPIHNPIPSQPEKNIEVVGGYALKPKLRRLIKDASNAVINGIQPSAAYGGLGGAYYFKNSRGENLAIVKPTDEEPFAPNNPNGYIGRSLGGRGVKRNIRVGEAGIREVAAYLLDHKSAAKVPHTALVKVTNSVFNVNDAVVKGREMVPTKLASFQEFVKHDYDASEHGTSGFPVDAIHWIGILDIRIFNLDRHAGNILVREVADDHRGLQSCVELTPIDHGFCLPDSLESPYFEWQHWSQSSLPFSPVQLEYIEALDPYADVEMLKRELNNILNDSCLRILVVSTTLLQIGAKAGLSLCDIAAMMCAEIRGMVEEPSELELTCLSVKDKLIAELTYSTSLDMSSHSKAEEIFDDQELFQLDFDVIDGESDSMIDSESKVRSLGREYGSFEAREDGSMEEPVQKDSSSSASSVSSPNFSPSSGKQSFGSLTEISELEPFSHVKGSMILHSKSFGSRNRTGLKKPIISQTRMMLSPIARSPITLPKTRSVGSSFFAPHATNGIEHESARDACNPLLEEIDSAFPAEGGLDFGKLSESTWKVFMRLFEEALWDTIEAKVRVNASLLKRFGSSCKF